MPSLHQPRRGGQIEVVDKRAATDVAAAEDDDGGEAPPEEKFINEYLQRNTKRIQVEPLDGCDVR